jgi:NTE family protein
MMRRLLVFALAATAAIALPASLRAQAAPATCGPDSGRVALVLAGGGAKGFAHLGVLRMLDSLGIVPDLVVGTSSGALFGALYASGLPVSAILNDVVAMGLDTLVGSYGPATPPSLGNRRAILAWEGGARGFELQTNVAREAPLNALVSALYLRGNLIARGDFDRLPIPFRAVAADLRTRQEVVLGTGDLAQAVRASASIPLVFRTVRLGGRDLVDGGIANNTPLTVARALGATRVVVSAFRDTALVDLTKDDPFTIVMQLANLLVQDSIPAPRPGELVLRSDVRGIGQLDFSSATVQRAIAAGEAAARAIADDRCLPRGNARPRGVVPPLASVFMPPGTDAVVVRLLRATLGDIGGTVPDVPLLQQRLRGLAQVERYRAVWLTPTAGAGDSVVFAPNARPASIERALVGAAFDRELGPRLWLGHVKQLSHRDAEVTEVVEIGDLEQDASVTLRRNHDVLSSPWSPLLSVLARRTQVRDIRGGREYPRISTDDWRFDLGIERWMGRRATASLALFVRQWDEPVFSGSPVAVGARWRLERRALPFTASGVLDAEATARYWRASVDWRVPWRIGDLTVEPAVSAVVGEHLPLQSSAFLGGAADGFPGFLTQELHGEQSGTLALLLEHPLAGPVSVRGRVTGGLLTTDGVGLFRDAQGYFGARVGFGIVTALGPVIIEYGANDRGRGRFWFRFGDWF